MGRALLVVDVQNDFYEEGKLPVPDASKINPVVNRLLKSDNYDVIAASQDWHPAGHKSYAVNMGKEPYTPFDNG
jgi:nicotinamidase/pyrazinamidase